MRAESFNKIFEACGLIVKHSWNVTFPETKRKHYSPTDREYIKTLSINELVSHLTDGFVYFTSCGIFEIRYGITGMMLSVVISDNDRVVISHLLKEPINFLDSSEQMIALRNFLSQTKKG